MVNGKRTISVIIPVYNVQEYLNECLNSVENQMEKNLEILCVNDGSLDKSGDILNQAAIKDSRIHVITQDNRGLSAARNTGIEAATGDYLAFVDGDDTIHPDMIEKLLSACEKNQTDIAVCDMEYLYPDHTVKFSSGGTFTCTSVKKNPSLIRINNSACNKLFRKNLFQDVRFPVGKYYEDLAVIPSLLYEAGSVAKVDEALYSYRQRSGSIAHTASEKIFEIYDAIDDNIRYVKSHGNETEILKELKHLYIVHGLDLTTLRIKDFDEKNEREEYLKKNMLRLKQSYPDYASDSFYKNASFKKKLIWKMLNSGQEKAVLKLYDRT